MGGQDESRAKGCVTVLVIALVLLFLVGSCVKDSWNDRTRDNRADKHGGGTILIEAPKKTCWYLEANDERLPDGRAGEDDGDLSSSEVDKVEASGGKFEEEACGPAEVTLPSAVVFGSVSVFVGDDDDRHNYAAWLWLTGNLVPRGGAVSVDGDGHENDTAVFASVASKVFSSDSWSGKVISNKPFGPATATQIDPDDGATLRKAGVDAGAFSADRAAAAAELTSNKLTGVEGARAALKRLAAPVAAATDVSLLAYTASDFGATGSIWRGKAPAMTLAALTDMEAGGEAVAALVPKLRKWLARRLLAQIRPDYDSSSAYADSAKAVPALGTIDPTQGGRWKALAREWNATANRMKVAEKAQEARDAAELDRQLKPPPTGSLYPGCDGDEDGICNE